jgi:hypothetical protein
MSVQVEGYRNESFESLEAAVLETQRGRWFLEEYARRQRSTETLAILDVLKKLENAMLNSPVSAASSAVTAAKPINREQLKFFKQDEEIFVEPVVAAPALTVVPAAPKEDFKLPVESKGAKLKIQRVGPTAVTEATMAVEPESPPTPVTAPEPVAITSAPPAPEQKQRVIIIRRPASEAAEIPMLEENKSEVAA